MCYFNNAFQYPSATIDTICHTLKDPKFDRVDFIVGTGMSGVLILLPVSIKSDIPCVAVRKTWETEHNSSAGGSHSHEIIENLQNITNKKLNNYIIIDDFTKSGGTIRKIQCAIRTRISFSQCVGIILYQSRKTHSPSWNNIPLTCLSEDIVELVHERKYL